MIWATWITLARMKGTAMDWILYLVGIGFLAFAIGWPMYKAAQSANKWSQYLK